MAGRWEIPLNIIELRGKSLDNNGKYRNPRTKWRFLAVKSIELGIFEQAMFDYQGFPFQKHRIIPIRAAYLHSSPFVANKHQQQILTILRASVHPVY